jgi:hypothetical protein
MVLAAASVTSADDKTGTDGEGFIQQWLVLAPIPFAANESASDAFEKEQIKDAAKLKPKAGDKIKIGDKVLTWQKKQAKDYLLDFNEILGKETEDSVAYAATYIVVPKELKGVKMKTGSDDQCRVYLNGKEVFKYAEERATEKDEDTTEVTLKEGTNVLIVKVVNAKADWSFCVRFTDQNDQPLKNLTAKAAP